MEGGRKGDSKAMTVQPREAKAVREEGGEGGREGEFSLEGVAMFAAGGKEEERERGEGRRERRESSV